MTTPSWLTDRTGLLSALLGECRGLEEAASLLAHVVACGQVVVSARDAQFFGVTELAAIFSLHLEALAGADVEERYAAWGGVGPRGTRHGEAILAAIERPPPAPDPPWADRLAAAGLRIEDVRSWQADGRLAGALERTFSVRIGRDFS